MWSRHTIVLNVWVWSRHQPKLIPGLSGPATTGRSHLRVTLLDGPGIRCHGPETTGLRLYLWWKQDRLRLLTHASRRAPHSVATDPWSIRPPGVVWEFIARTKTASGHLYRGLRSYGPGISQRAAAARTQTVWRWLVVTGHKLQAASYKLDSPSRRWQDAFRKE